MSDYQNFKAYKGINGKAVISTSTHKELDYDQVLIRITHSGLCYSDVHFLNGTDDKNNVLGHEPVGVIEKVGSQVNNVKVGDRVGYGCIHLSCQNCDNCRLGNDNLCDDKIVHGLHDHHQGSFGTYVILNAGFVHVIPDNLPSELAAPLNCAGATVFGPFLKYNIKPIHRVAVLGIGGLGHLAVQVARAWGCHVTALTSSESKIEEAKSFGAHEVLVTKREGQSFVPQKFEQKFDFILGCGSAQSDWFNYVLSIRPRGTLIMMSVDFHNSLQLPYAPIVMNDISVSGSIVSNRYEHSKMLEFCARHNIKPQVEVLDLSEENLNIAFDRIKKNDVRYRFVLKH